MAKLADILVSLTLETKEFNSQLKSVARNIESLSNSVGKATTTMQTTVQNSTSTMSSGLGVVEDAMERMDSAIGTATTNAGKSFSRFSNSSSSMARRFGTDMQSQYMILKQAQKEYDSFSMAGRRVSQEIKEEFSALPSHLQRYVQSLREAGKSTQGFAVLNQQYSQRVIEGMQRQNDFLQQKATQASKLMQSISQNTNLAPLTNGFLQLGSRMEQTARQGSVLNLALQRIGPNASLKDLQDQMNLISQGIGRARGAFLVFGISAGLATLGMINLAAAVDSRVAPAFERMKSALVDAMEPFIHSFATAMVAVMNFVTNLANMVNKFSEANPLIFNMIMWIGLLTLAFGTLLAPLAVTGVMAEGVAASFAVLWAMIAPFVLGFLAVIGVAIACAAAFVGLWVAIQQLWTNSTSFAAAFTNLWNGIKMAVIDNFATPVMTAWNGLKLAFANLVSAVTGGSTTMSSLWTTLGNAIAIVVGNIADVILPLFRNAMTLLGNTVASVVNAVTAGVNWMAQAWQNHSATIMPILTSIWMAVLTAFQAIASFIGQIMPQIIQIATSGWDLIKAAIDFTMKYIAPVVVAAFTVIWNIIQMVMPLILSIITGTWSNIKSVITSAIAIITNVIQLFANVLKGNWKGAWDNICNITKNVLTLVWNLIQLYFLGKLLAPLRAFGSSAKGLVTSAFNGIKSVITGIMNGIKAFLVGVWQAILSSLRGSFTGILNLGRTTFNNLKSAISTAVNAVKPIVTRVFNAVKTAITKPVETAKNTVLKIISQIVKAFASMKISIPKFKLPSVEVGSKSAFGGKVKVPTFKVNWHATGGIFNAATLLGNGSHGVGEAGNEAVMPIQHKRYMKPFSDAVAANLADAQQGSKQNGGANQYIIQFNEPVYIREEADINKIVKEMEKKQRIAERAKGTFSYAK
jgi:phage-related protein